MSVAPNPENYMVGSGVVFFDYTTPAGVKMGEMDLGNTPAFVITPTIETLDHFESRTPQRGKDASVDISKGFTVKFTLEEYSMDNLALIFYSEAPATTVQGAGSVLNEDITARHDKWVKVDYRKITNVAVKNETETVTYDADDYNIDHITGRVKALSTGSITDGQALSITYDYSSLSYPTISGMTLTPVEGYLRFIGDPMHGPVLEVEVWKVKLKPTSDVAFIGTEWGAVEMEAEVLRDAINHPDDPWFKVYERAVGFTEAIS